MGHGPTVRDQLYESGESRGAGPENRGADEDKDH